MFEQLKNLRQMAGLLGNAGQMRERMEAIQEKLRGRTVTGAAGGGVVEVDCNGLGEISAVRIDPSLLTVAAKAELEQLLPLAIDQAIRKSKQLHIEAVTEIAGDLPIPGMQEALKGFVDGERPGS